MATASSSVPLLYSVLTSSHDNNEDFVNQLRNHLNQIETNVQQSLSQIQQHKPYTSLKAATNPVDSTMRNKFFTILRDVASKNNLPFDESLFRRQILDKQDSSTSLKVDIVRATPTLTNDNNDQHLSPVNNTRRSQFAPVLSSTPVHQTSPITPIPIDLTMATPSVAPVLTKTTDALLTVLPSAIVPQRAKVGRTGGRPPRIPRGESVTREKHNTSNIKEQQEETILAKEVYISSKRQIKGNEEIIEENVEIVIEQTNEILPDIIKQVQTTPLRGKARKVNQENVNIIPQLESPPPVSSVQEIETITTKTRGGRGKKKVDEKKQEVKPTRVASARNRNKKEEVIIPEEAIPKSSKRMTRTKNEDIISNEEVTVPIEKISLPSKRTTKNKKEPTIQKEEVPEPSKRTTRNKKQDVIIPKEDIPQASKRVTRNKKLDQPIINTEEKPSTVKMRATPSRSKKILTMDKTEPIILATPKKIMTKSNKRKGIDDATENPIDTIQPSSPKRRFGRNTKSKSASVLETIEIPPTIEPELQQPRIMLTRTSRRGKKDIEIPIEKQEVTVLNKTTRTGRGNKTSEPINTDSSTTVADLVMTSVTVSAPVTSSVKTLISKPPRPPIARKKKSIAMPPISQTSPSTPSPTISKRIQSTSPIADKPLLPLPVPTNGGRRRQPQREVLTTPPRVDKPMLETLPSNTRNLKRTRSSVAITPKRVRRDDLVIVAVPSTPGRKRNACTCQKRRNKICDICAAAIES
ncbi:unnamed protein product [Rotaria socialis]|uniref:Uncharacterized protein n=1 Tax=Rotaria socialis TaxID=392032 RepID=A0A821RCE2_9BILA|nr:unnamed protein product [Rotaria socialis]CAF4838841.1 unnamed protein product [Rotaria socialis]